MPPKTTKYISIFVLIAALLPTLFAFDLPVETPAFSPSSDVIVPPPITGDGGSISAPPLSSSIAPSSDLNSASNSSFTTKNSDLSPSSAPGSPKTAISLPPNAGAPVPESFIVNGGEDVNSEGPSYSAPSPYTDEQTAPQATAPGLNGGGEQGSFDMAPSIANPNVLPFEYRAEEEPVDPYPREETHGGVHGAVAGVIVGVGMVGLAGFVYHKKKNGNNVRAQYQYLGRNNMKKSVSL